MAYDPEMNRRFVELVSDLSTCQDAAEIHSTAARHYAGMFGPFRLYGLLTSDSAFDRWRSLGLANPNDSEPAGLRDDQLPRNVDLDAVAEASGAEVSQIVRMSPALWSFLSDPEQVQVGTTETHPEFVHEIMTLFPLNAQAVMAGTWRRPVGGVGCALLLYDSMQAVAAYADLFRLCVLTTARMAFYPGFAQFLQRQQAVSESLRRNMVHDLKTPLAVIKGYAETILAQDAPEEDSELTEMVAAIVEQTDRMLLDVNDILSPIAEAWEPRLEPFDLCELVQMVVVAERHTARAAKLKFEVHMAADSLVVQADRRKIRRVLENLISNAVKYSLGAGKTVTVRVHSDDTNAYVHVADEGVGMDERHLAAVLSGAGRTTQSPSDVEGHGFGLDSVRRVLEAHGGTLTGSSTVGRGSVFVAQFPIRPSIAATS